MSVQSRQSGTLNFHESLTAIGNWADKWKMDVNVKKSKILHTTTHSMDMN